MRYRRSSYRYAMVVRSGGDQPFGEGWPSDRLRLLLQGRWAPDSDTYETARTIEVVVDLAGVDEDDFEGHLFAGIFEARHRGLEPRGILDWRDLEITFHLRAEDDIDLFDSVCMCHQKLQRLSGLGRFQDVVHLAVAHGNTVHGQNLILRA